MPLYTYIAIDLDGRETSGTLVADSPRQLREELREQRLIAHQVSEQSAASGADRAPAFGIRRPNRVSMLIRELSTLTHAGIPLTDALSTLIRQHTGIVKEWVMQLKDRVEQGTSLADAMSEQPAVFDKLSVNMVRVGENAGNLEEVLSILADFAEKSLTLKNRLFSALLYPALVFVGSIGVSVFLMTFVVPELLQSLVEAGRPLPWPTRILKGCSDILLQHGWWIGAIAIFAVVGLLIYVRTDRGQVKWHKLQLSLPLIGGLAFRQAMSRTSYVIATLLRSGLDLTKAMSIAGETCQNRIIASELVTVNSAISSGRELGPAFEQSSVFPPLVVQIFAVGQQSGQLEDMLERLSTDYEHQVDTLSNRLATILEPVTIIFLTTLVGFILTATILPILEAGNAL